MSRLIIFSIISCIITAIAIYPNYARNHSSLLTINSRTVGELPRNFRLTNDKTSGSGQYSENALVQMIDAIPHSNILIVDLRQEPHGFVGGHSISWYRFPNWLYAGKSWEEVTNGERALLNTLKEKTFSFIFKDRLYPRFYWINDVMTQEEMVKKYGIGYLRIPVCDHTRPDDKAVDFFVNYVRNIQEDTWLHFHCSAGKGRTTTFLALHHMITAKTLRPLDEIVQEQINYGGLNLYKVPPKDVWKHDCIKERVQFIKDFYQYRQEQPEFAISWSEWINLKGKNE